MTRARRIAIAIVVTLASGVLGAAAQRAGENVAPRFEVDAAWPKPLPHRWLMGQAAGVAPFQRGAERRSADRAKGGDGAVDAELAPAHAGQVVGDVDWADGFEQSSERFERRVAAAAEAPEREAS